jgi:hypothetical protein
VPIYLAIDDTRHPLISRPTGNSMGIVSSKQLDNVLLCGLKVHDQRLELLLDEEHARVSILFLILSSL